MGKSDNRREGPARPVEHPAQGALQRGTSGYRTGYVHALGRSVVAPCTLSTAQRYRSGWRWPASASVILPVASPPRRHSSQRSLQCWRKGVDGRRALGARFGAKPNPRRAVDATRNLSAGPAGQAWMVALAWVVSA